MISPKTKAMHEELSSELHTLNQTWRYVENMTSDLFGAGTLKRASQAYFETVLKALWVYGLTLLYRLLDRANSGKSENCSLLGMTSILREIPPQLVESLEEIRARAKRLLQYRNKQIAHLDLDATLQENPDQEPLFSWVRMHETITDLNRWMNNFESFVGLSVQYYALPEGWGDVDEVGHILRKGMSAIRATSKSAQ